MEPAADFDGAAAEVAAHVELAPGLDLHFLTGHRDLAAFGLGAGGDGAGDLGLALAGVDRHLGIQEVRGGHFRAGIHLHAQHVGIAAVVAELLLHRLDRAAVAHRALLGGGGDGDGQVAVTGLLQGDFGTGGERHIAVPGLDGAAVDHGPANQEHIPLAGQDHAGVADHGLGVALEGERLAAQELVVGQVKGGGGEAIGIDNTRSGDENAVGVDQAHPPVGHELAGNLGRHAANDPVEHGGTRIRLNEIGDLAAADGERIPVDDGAVRGRRDVQRAACRIQGGTTDSHLGSFRIAPRHRGHGEIDGATNTETEADLF